MKRKLKNAIKDAYGFPQPQKKDDFFKNIEKKEKKNKPVPFYINLMKYSAVPATAAVALIIFTSFIHNQNVKYEFVTNDNAVTDVQDNETIDEDIADALEDETCFTETDISSDYFERSRSDIIFSEMNENNENSERENAPANDSPVQSEVPLIPEMPNNRPLPAETTASTTAPIVSGTDRTTHKTTTVTASKTTAKVTTTVKTANAPETSLITSTEYEYDMTVPSQVPIQTTTPEPQEPDGPSVDTVDLRVKPPVVYNKIETPIDVSSAFEDNSFDDIQSTYSWRTSAAYAYDAIYGRIDEFFYTSIDGKPYIQADLFVESSMKSGDLHYGDMISIYIPGGYMPMSDFLEENSWYRSELGDISEEEILNSTAFYNNGNHKLIKTGKEYLFFINYSMPNGAFTLFNEMDIYTRVRSSRYYCCKNRNISFTQNELISYF